ncbi:MAG: hypothetical protein KGV44_12130 [Flavobacteriaceae bacterium]|nr:hypothetical protein [Flavobacteriaceae bacterium]
MTLNEQLKELYESKWEDLCKAMKPIVENDDYQEKPAYPLLLSTNQYDNEGNLTESWYADADLKVMVFGQETNKWTADEKSGMDDFGTPPNPVFDPEISLGAVMGLYEDFYSSRKEEKGFNFNNRYGTFHYGFSTFIKLLTEKIPNKSFSFLWNNISKFGLANQSGKVPNYIYDIEQKYFSVIEEEIRILQPDIILFLTGSDDNKIMNAIGGCARSPLLAPECTKTLKMIFPKHLNILAYRTYHPSARAINAEEKIEHYQAIVNNIEREVLLNSRK